MGVAANCAHGLSHINDGAPVLGSKVPLIGVVMVATR